MDLEEYVSNIIGKTELELKDFQKATVDHVMELYAQHQDRVLVADEVGLGKTLVAKGVIARMARLHLIEEGGESFRVIYICSNQSIANQNIRKLNVLGAAEERISETRLSMQHLRIAEMEKDAREKSFVAQLIPLTPDTSFRMTSGGGSVEERALIYAILSRMNELENYKDVLNELLIYGASSSWNTVKEKYEARVKKCDEPLYEESDQSHIPDQSYSEKMISKIRKYVLGQQKGASGQQDILSKLTEHLQCRRDGSVSRYRDRDIIGELRIMFAHISIDMMRPDFVIMDEFQRFQFLLQQGNEKEKTSEVGLLVDRFFNTEGLRILLLSATPFKLYATSEEIAENQGNESFYNEFKDVVSFLYSDDEKFEHFNSEWSGYETALRKMKVSNTDLISMKNAAEDTLYGIMCRTERNSVMDISDDINDDNVRQPLKITENDVIAYKDAEALIKNINAKITFPVDYVKSSPYLLSFMKDYQIKKNVEEYCDKFYGEGKWDEAEQIIHGSKNDENTLWLNAEKIKRYQQLPQSNARLEDLKRQIFTNNSELYMWVPPSMPYYEMGGPYKDSENFSKILVFSAWEMVPRMIGGLISYESEQRTVGRLIKNRGRIREQDRKNLTYNANSRYPYRRLTFRTDSRGHYSSNLLCLLYPSKTLAKLYQPVNCLNAGWGLSEIQDDIQKSLKQKISEIKEKFVTRSSSRPDDRWYYLAPMLMDGDYASVWVDKVLESKKNEKEDNEEDEKSTSKFLTFLKVELKTILDQIIHGESELGSEPYDLIDVLTDMTLGSPAVCIYRSNGQNAVRATDLAQVFVNRFNQPETTAIVELAYPEQVYDETNDDYDEQDNEHIRSRHWQRVLRYCKDGNFQSMFDEYVHMVTDGEGFGLSEEKDQAWQSIMMDALSIRTASYEFDTPEKLYKRMPLKSCSKNDKQRTLADDSGEESENTSFKLRAHFAVGFIQSESDETRKVRRKDSIRNAFNSPMRPFVLATTSIGQEGLDFHFYCRKVMHWNLPGNPIDLEQREGRVNRYKCLAIRQNAAQKYGHIHFEHDIWNEIFDAAEKNEKSQKDSDLIPYWCFGHDMKIKIERLVPMYPFSMDEKNYERLIQVLALYRLAFGQPRQEELIDHLFSEIQDTSELKQYFINLSPYSKQCAFSQQQKNDGSYTGAQFMNE